jgi:hypothetical protein
MYSDQHDQDMIAGLVRIEHLHSAGMIKVHIWWKDSGFRGRMLNNHILSEHFLNRLQVRFMESLEKQMPVRIVTCNNQGW